MRPHLRRAFGLVSIIAVGVGAPLSFTAANAVPAAPSGEEPLIVFRSTANMFVPEGKEAVWDIWAVHPDGSGLQRLTHDRANDSFPDISPDGSTVIFDSSRQGGEIYALTLATGAVRALTSSPGETESAAPAFSPDGTRIAFMRLSVPTYEWSLYIMNSDGTNAVRVTDVNSDIDPLRPTWSPDGTRLAFASSKIDGVGNLHIVVVNADGSDRHQITRGSGEYEPAWSPDGTLIAYFEKDSVWVMNPDGSDARRVVRGELAAFQPTWSPDGKRLAYVNESPGHTDLYAVGLDGTHPRPLTRAQRDKADEAPSWGGTTPTALLAGGGAVELAGNYDILLVPIAATCTGYIDCADFRSLKIALTITSNAAAGQVISVAGHDTTLVAQGGGYVASGELPAELTTATCFDEPWTTSFEMRFTVDATDPAAGDGTRRAQRLRGTYTQTNPERPGCFAASISYVLTGPRASNSGS